MDKSGFSPTVIYCEDTDCQFSGQYHSWTIACLAAGRHTAATGHSVAVSAYRAKTFEPRLLAT